MNVEAYPAGNQNEQESSQKITYELAAYVFECMPDPGQAVHLEQLAEDLEETPDTILAVMNELRCDGLLDYTHNGDSTIVTQKDQDFLRMYTVYRSHRR